MFEPRRSKRSRSSVDARGAFEAGAHEIDVAERHVHRLHAADVRELERERAGHAPISML
jgi:hypothetical protein